MKSDSIIQLALSIVDPIDEGAKKKRRSIRLHLDLCLQMFFFTQCGTLIMHNIINDGVRNFVSDLVSEKVNALFLPSLGSWDIYRKVLAT